MRFRRDTPPREEELAALADGSLPPERRQLLEDFVAHSAEHAALLEEQKRVVGTLRGLGTSVEAPAGLRTRVEGERRRRAAPAPRRRYAWAGGLAAAAVAAAVAVVLALPGNVPGGPSVAEAAVLASRPATEPAPALQSPTLLAESVEGVPYPNWLKKFGWKATGARVDTLDGHRATTVFYEKNGRRIGYTIFAGDALKEPEDAARITRDDTELRALTVDGEHVVTWLRRGHTCIITGPGVDRPTLVKLAAWNGKGTVPF
jgi:hypothetical protein